MTCWSCGATIDDQDNFCRRCGMGQGSHLPYYYKPFAIVLLTIFALGPFALPLVWKTPRWKKNGKLIASALVLLYTAWLVWTVYRWTAMAQSLLDSQMQDLGLSPQDLKKLGLQ